MVCAGDQILGAWSFADEHAALVVFFQDVVERIDLRVDFVGGDDILRVDQHQLIAVSLDQFQHILRQDVLGNIRAKQAVDAVHAGNAVHLLHFCGHAAYIRLRDVGIDQQQMRGGRVEGLLQLLIGHDRRQVLRHYPAHVIVDIHMTVAIESRDAEQHQKHSQHSVMSGDKTPDAAHIRQQRPVTGLFDCAVQQPDHAGQQYNRSQQSQHNAFAHHNAKVFAQGKAHETNGDKAGDGRQTRPENRGEGQMNGFGHRLIPVLCQCLLLLVAVPQEDGIVQRDSQLQDSSHCLGDIADLTQEEVRAHVPQDGYADAQQKDQREQEGIHRDHQDQSAQRNGDGDIGGFLGFHQFLGVGDDGGQSADKTLFTSHFPHLLDGFHGGLRGGTLIEEDGGQHTVTAAEFAAKILRNDLQRELSPGEGSIPDDGIHVGNLPDGILHVSLFPDVHSLGDQQGKRAFAEILQQDLLTFYGLQVLRQVIE